MRREVAVMELLQHHPHVVHLRAAYEDSEVMFPASPHNCCTLCHVAPTSIGLRGATRTARYSRPTPVYCTALHYTSLHR